MSGNQVQNKRGEWVPAIPVPLFEWLHLRRCGECRKAYFTMAGYRGHYALEHILETP